MSDKTDREKFLDYRRQQEASVVAKIGDDHDPMMSMLSIELNTTELCNRKCVFCPRVDPEIYPNRNLNMTVKTAEKIAADLAAVGFKGRISFSGFGEPILNKKLPDLIRAVRRHLPDNLVDTNTNGDKLTAAMVRNVFDAGISAIYINMYDGPDQEPKFRAILSEAGVPESKFKLRPHWNGAEDNFGLILNNRSGMISDATAGGLPEEPIRHPCYYPFSRAMIDWNGDMLLCTNDWGRARVVGSVHDKSIRDLWLSPSMLEARAMLAQGDRNHRPCDKCNVDGTLSGKFGFDLLLDHYRATGQLPEATATPARKT